MGWVYRVEPGHSCDLPMKDLGHTERMPGGSYQVVGLIDGSTWVCSECQTIWVVVPGDPDGYASYEFTRMTPRLRKRYKL